MTHRPTLVAASRTRVSALLVGSLLIVTLGLVMVVVLNLQTSEDLQKESEEAHLLAEMQVSLLAIDQLVNAWQLDPVGEPPVTEDPMFPSLVADFHDGIDELSLLIDEAELVEVNNVAVEFDNYVASLRANDGSDRDLNQQLAAVGLSIRAPLQDLLEEENDHLLESVRADRRSEEMLRWGLPLLLLLGIAVTVVVFRLQRRSRMLDEAERMSDAKNEFIGSVSHELRTPLTPVVGFSHELRDRIGHFSSEEVVEFAEIIATASDEVAAIVDDLLTAARLDAGALPINPEVVDLESLLKHVLNSADRPKDISINVAGSVCADRGRLTQIIRNLVSNARRYGGHTIEITNRTIGNNVLLVVSDSGPGIPSELSEGIFEPFTSAHQVDGLPASVGLGLTVSRRLARLMGGDLTYVRDEGWSRLNLTLPGIPQPGPSDLPATAKTSACM